MKWSGLYTPLITPFKNDELDEEGLKNLIQMQKQAGVSGLVLLGTTAEFLSLSEEENERIVKIAKAEAPHLPLVVGVGSPSTREAIRNLERAIRLGADAALVITPFYNKPSQEGLFSHYEVLSNLSFPLFVYNNPSRTAVHLELETLRKIAELPAIIGMKDSAGNVKSFAETVSLMKKEFPHFVVWGGDDSLLFPFLTLGADGAVASAANAFPERIQELVSLTLNKEFERARACYFELLPLFEVLSIASNPVPLKYAMSCLGLPAGIPRLPLTSLNPFQKTTIEQLFQAGF